MTEFLLPILSQFFFVIEVGHGFAEFKQLLKGVSILRTRFPVGELFVTFCLHELNQCDEFFLRHSLQKLNRFLSQR